MQEAEREGRRRWEYVLSEANLRRFVRSSPTPSSSSLDKYLEESLYEEGISTTAVDSALRAFRPLMSPQFSMPSRPSRPDSIVGSDSSAGSFVSIRSVDPRGQRRGRKNWTQSPFLIGQPECKPYGHRDSLPDFHVDTHLLGPKPQHLQQQSAKSKDRKHIRGSTTRLFCTWPTCNATFAFKSEWTRHEEAKHYQPWRWICCLDDPPDNSETRYPCFVCLSPRVNLDHIKSCHFSSCWGKDLESRTFLRKDHLVQHITGTHLKKCGSKFRVPEYLITAWKTTNPSMSEEALHCGFCGLWFKTWPERQEHVYLHIRDQGHRGLGYKASWR